MPAQSLLAASAPHRPCVCESLEPRRLPVATAQLGAGGVLTVLGTENDDRSEFSLTGESRGALRLSVVVDSVDIAAFRYEQVKRIVIFGGAGNDELRAWISHVSGSTTLSQRVPPATLFGGPGNDRLDGGRNNHRLDGSDTLRGGAGDDLLDGNGDYSPPLPPGTIEDRPPPPGNGPWNDAIYGGPGSDTFFSFDKPGEQKDLSAEDALV